MPVKLGSKLPNENAEARIEIIPLIDIMFFLLAAFMLVLSLSMVNLKGMKVNLPTATSATSESKRNVVDVSVDKDGDVFLDKKPIGDNELMKTLADAQKGNPDFRVIISGDAESRHGRMIHVLDLIRIAGIDKVAFETRLPSAGGKP